jgi:hypothetical protein
MNQEVRDQIGYAYGLMSLHARYRPAALGDGLGNIYLSPRHLDINKEIEAYAREWWAAEDERRFWIGCCKFATRPATILTVEAARSLCGCQEDLAAQLLVMAKQELLRAARVRPQHPHEGS